MFTSHMPEILPPSSNAIPIISVYFFCVMVMSSLSLVVSVIVISLHFQNARNCEMPMWVSDSRNISQFRLTVNWFQVRKYICYYLARLLLMKRPGYDLTWNEIHRKWDSIQEKTNSINQSDVMNSNYRSLQSIDKQEQQHSNSAMKFSISSLTKIQSVNHHNLFRVSQLYQMKMIRSKLRLIISHLSILTKQTRQREELDSVSEDWKFVAMIIDRLCLILFSISMTLFTAFTLLSTPIFLKLR